MTSETRLFPSPGGKGSLEAGDVLTPRFGADGTIACVTVAAVSRRSSPTNFEAMLTRLKAACAEIAHELGS